MNMQEKLLQLKNEILAQLWQAKSLEEVENIRISSLGKNGRLTSLLKELPKI